MRSIGATALSKDQYQDSSNQEIDDVHVMQYACDVQSSGLDWLRVYIESFLGLVSSSSSK